MSSLLPALRMTALAVGRPDRRGLLRPMASLVRAGAPLLVLFFTLHCTRPRFPATAARAVPDAGVPAGLFVETGEASWYGGGGDGFSGRATASGERMDPAAMTCAHKTLPLGTLVQVENLDNGQKGVFRVNDRGPFVRGRIVDVSPRGARVLGLLGPGVARVRLHSVDAQGRPAPLEAPQVRDNPFTIQVAALSDPVALERLRRELEARLAPVVLQEVRGRDGRPLTRLRVGSYPTHLEALQAADQMASLFKDRGVDPFITRLH